MAYVKFGPRPTIKTVDIVAAAILAYETNSGRILRMDTRAEEDGTIITDPYADPTPNSKLLVNNKTQMQEMFDDTGAMIFAHNRTEEAEEMIGFITQKSTMNMLQGIKIPDFAKAVNDALQNEDSDYGKIGLLLYVPQIYGALKEKEKLDGMVAENKYSSKPLGQVGAKVSIDLTVFKVKPMRFNDSCCWSVFGKDEFGNLVAFFTSHKHLTESQKMTAKVKSFGKDQYHSNVMVTKLNYVKAVS